MADEILQAMEQELARLLEQVAIVERDIANHKRHLAKYKGARSTSHSKPAAKRGRKARKKEQSPDGTIASLIARYKNHEDSGYLKAAYSTRLNYDSLLKRIAEDGGEWKLADLKAQDIQRSYEEWKARGESVAHSLITMLRQLFGFGATVLGDPQCERLSVIMHKMYFPMIKPRSKGLTAAQANAIRATAHEMGLPMVALAQAFQFDCKFRQKDVIGEWVPQDEPGMSDEIHPRTGRKWLRGLRWSEIDNLILRHFTVTKKSKEKEIVVDLRRAPMVTEEFKRLGELPASGPIIIDQDSGRPYRSHQFRRQWRAVATAAGIPSDVFNMDSRADADDDSADDEMERGSRSGS